MSGAPFIDTVSGDFKFQGTSGTPAVLAQTDGSVHLVPLVHPFTGSSGYQSIGSSSFTGIGLITFDPSALFSTNGKVIRSIKFEAILECTSGVTGEIKLYNISVGSEVTSSLLSTSANSPTLVSSTLAIGVAPNVPNSQQIYEIQLRISVPATPSASDRVICKLGQLVVIWN